MNTGDLIIDVAENGFIVRENKREYIGKIWAFESAESLAGFIREWGDGNTKVKVGIEESRPKSKPNTDHTPQITTICDNT